MSKSTLWSFTALSCTTFSTPLFSADALDPVLVTATRTSQSIDTALAAVSVVTSKDIQRMQAQSVQDVLRAMPGISLTNNGGAGKISSVFMRGTESDHLLVMINGIKVGSPTVGTTLFQNIPVDQIERIEIVRGPRSSLYGSEAIGGVIQIFTKKGSEKTSVNLSLGGGSFNATKATAGVSGKAENLWYNLNLAHEKTDGFDSCEGNLGAGCFADEPDDDGFDNTSSAFQLGSNIGDKGDWKLHFLRAEGSNEFDGSVFSGNESDNKQQVIGAEIQVSPADNLQLRFKAGQSKDDSEFFFNGATNSYFDTQKDNFSIQGDWSVLSDGLLTVGIDYNKDSVSSSTAYDVTSRDNTGAFIQYLSQPGPVDVELSIRGDDNQQFGNHSSGGIAVSHVHNNGWRVTASAGSAYKAPSFNELYFPNFGNHDLQPEESVSYELGVSNGGRGGIRWSANLYQTDISDLIAFNSVTFASDNIEKARIRGLELETSTSVAGWNLHANANLLDPINNGSSASQGNDLPRRARQSIRVDLDRNFAKYSFGASYIAQGERFDTLDNTQLMGGYGILDLTAGYRINEHWQLQARVGNVFNKDYQTAKFYNQADRNLFLTINYQPIN